MFIVHVHCSLFMFIVHCSHGATLIFDDLFHTIFFFILFLKEMKIFAAVSGSRAHTVCARRQLKLVSLFRKKIVTFYIKMHI